MIRAVRDRLRAFVGRPTPDRVADGSEQDVDGDPALASSRAAGGRHATLSGDRGSVTGTGDTETFVGQIAGDDLGYAGETGAERRAEAAHHDEQATPDSTAPSGGDGADE